MTATDYILDSLLVLLVLMQIKERELKTRTMIRPLVIVGIAAANYLHGVPTAGNDLVLVAVLASLGATIGIASGKTVMMRTDADGRVLARSGWISGIFWVLGMGSRFAFLIWITHGGASALETFSIHHSITSHEAWTVALLAMAVFEVAGRTLVIAARRRRLQETARHVLTAAPGSPETSA
ncbi:MAG TPA: hypothetical protein VGF95_12455 [Solirubrobacteraceae bacterium]|jgi:hypothetical protein